MVAQRKRFGVGSASAQFSAFSGPKTGSHEAARSVLTIFFVFFFFTDLLSSALIGWNCCSFWMDGVVLESFECTQKTASCDPNGECFTRSEA